jgi:hypothetical protein
MNRSVIKYLNESIPFLQAPIVGSKKDFPVYKDMWNKDSKKTKKALAVMVKDNKT